MALRADESRLLDDESLAKSPNLPANHPHQKMWRMRQHGLRVLLKNMQRKLNPGDAILDIGCGNGWMSNRLAEAGFDVTAIDVNLPELEQAHRVFTRPGLRFAFADVFSWSPDKSFKAVVFGSSFQYFKEAKKVLDHLFKVNPDLKYVFIVDTPFYAPSEQQAAAQRSTAYYTRKGYPEMSQNYHHHSLKDLEHPYQVLYRPPHGFLRKLILRSPFPIIAVNSSR